MSEVNLTLAPLQYESLVKAFKDRQPLIVSSVRTGRTVLGTVYYEVTLRPIEVVPPTRERSPSDKRSAAAHVLMNIIENTRAPDDLRIKAVQALTTLLGAP